MAISNTKSFAAPVRGVLDGLLVIVGLFAATEALLLAILLVNPLHPLREHFHVTTLAAVPTDVWPTDGIARVASPSATASVAPWAFITFRPTSRAFVAATAAASVGWWGCVVLILVQLRRVLKNISGATPFPRDNIRRIRMVGGAILGLAAVNLLIDAAMFTYMRSALTVADRPPVIPTAIMLVDFPLGTIMAGLAVVILAEIFRAGADLQDDQAFTI